VPVSAIIPLAAQRRTDRSAFSVATSDGGYRLAIPDYLNASAFLEELRSLSVTLRAGAFVVSVREGDPVPDIATIERMASLPIVVIALAQGPLNEAWQSISDVVADEGSAAADDIVATVGDHPLASTTLSLLLRGSSQQTVAEGLVAESAAYSTLQGGPEFAQWRSRHPARRTSDDAPRVRVEREQTSLVVTLTRPDRRNALDSRMRDELLDALGIALSDPGIATVELRGDGVAFCGGGDLDEFGSRADPASAHVIRLQRSLGRAVYELHDRTTAFVHGATVGSGIELAAFAGRVVARSDTVISLPEVGLGLIPGAGGTVSLPRRIGRLRTAWLALSGQVLDAPTALSWGLVDELDDSVVSAQSA
jgi:enoyl-CoA hydratase/carnithine racemase